MAKTSIKVKCDSVISNANNSNVRFVVELPPIPAREPGQPPTRVAKTVVQIQFADSESATAFKSGKSYVVTIEG